MQQHTPRQIRVSIVEDSIDLNKTLEMMINATYGMTCISTHFDGQDAIAKIPDNIPDILLIDLGLPKVNGIEVIRELKEQIPALLCLVLTIQEDDDEVFGALKAGASGYLLKSDSQANIIDGIRDIYDGGAPMTAQIARKVVSYFNQGSDLKSPYEDLLTNRQKEVLHLLADGKFYKEIASDLHISIETVKSHCHKIYEILHVSNRTDALNKYFGHRSGKGE